MAYRVEFTTAAQRDFRKLPTPARKRVQGVIELLKETPRPPKAKLLKGKLHGFYRVRTGPYRVIYMVEEDRLVVCIVRIGGRKDVYQRR